MSNKLLTIQEAAQFLGISATTLRRYEERGILSPQRTPGNQRRYSQSQLETFKNGLASPESLDEGGTPPSSSAGYTPANSNLNRTLVEQALHGLSTIQKQILVGSLSVMLSSALVVGTIKALPAVFSKQDATNSAESFGLAQDKTTSEVLGDTTLPSNLTFNVNVPSIFKETAEFNNGLTIAGKAVNAAVATAPNVVFSLSGGPGISIAGTENPVVTNTGVLSLGGTTGVGDIKLGTGLSLSSGTLSSTDKIFKTIKLGSDSFSASTNTDTLELVAGTGTTISLDTSNKKVTIGGTNNSGWTDDGTVVRLTTSTDKVAIGKTTANYNLDISGNASISSTLSLAPILQVDAGTCNAASTGTIYYDITNTGYYYCNGSSWSSITSSGTNWWDLNNGALYPKISTSDLLVGGTSSSAAKFAVLNVNSGTPTASVSAGTAGGAYLTATGTLQTTANQTLTIGGNSTGNIVVAPLNGATGSYVGPNTNNQVDLGTSALSFRNLYLTGNLVTGNSGVAAFWQRVASVLSPSNITDDLLLGATTTTSARFAFINSVAPGTPTASISAQNASGQALTLGGDETIQSVRNHNLTLGGNSTGNIIVSPLNGAVGGAILPSTDNQVDLGSAALSFRNLYLDGNLVSTGTQAGFWSSTNGTIYPSILTQDLLIGGNASTSANFHAYGAGAFAGTNPAASVSGNTSFAGLVVDNRGSGDLFTASSSGVTQFVIRNNGAVGIGKAIPTAALDVNGNIIGVTINATTGINTGAVGGTQRIDSSGNLKNIGTTQFNTVTYTWPSADGTLGYVLSTNGSGTLSWADAGTATSNFWRQNTGVVYPANSTVDLLVGGVSTTSANFHAYGASPFAGTNPAASVSGNTRWAAFQVDNRGAGDLIAASSSGVTQFVVTNNGAVGIRTANPVYALDVNGNLNLSTGNTFKIAGTDVLSGTTLGSGVTASSLTSVGTITSGTWRGTAVETQYGGTGINGSSAGNGTLLIGNGTGYTLANLTAGSNIGITNAAGSITIANTETIDKFWNQSSGLLFANNSTVDLTIGGQSSTSSKFAILNVATGTPTASISAQNASNQALVLGSDETIQSVRNQNLTIGGNTTGNIVVAPLNGAVGGVVIPSTNNQVDLGTSALSFRNLYLSGNLVTSGSQAGFWSSTNGAIYPAILTEDLLIGGSASTSANFHAYGTAAFAGTNPAASVSGNTRFAAFVIDNRGSGDILTASSSGQNRFVVANNGNVGIGTALPASNLDISGTTPSLRITDTSYTTGNVTATGGTITNSGGYTIHTFNSSGTFTVTGSSGNVDVLVVAGGGGGGGYSRGGGGGGGGGVVYNTSYAVTAQAYTVTVGSGGTGGATSTSVGGSGGNSSFSTITATGGGGGAYGNTDATLRATTGGSGGGGADGVANSTDNPGAAGTAGQGYAGGNGHHTGSVYSGGGGGGGGGGVGGDSVTVSGGGTGGPGLANSISGSSVTYAGGGGGGNNLGSGGVGAGGSGGGGAGGNTSTSGTNGTANTGGGGGGGGGNSGGAGGTGGSGIVIVRYLTNGGASSPQTLLGTNNGGVFDLRSSSGVAGSLLNLDLPNARIGIGTSAPIDTLDVRGNSGTTGIASFSGSTSFAGLIADNTQGDLFTASSSGQNRFVVKNSGNVNIGTQSAALAPYKLYVSDYKPASAAAMIENTGDNGNAANCAGRNECHIGLLVKMGLPGIAGTALNSTDRFIQFMRGDGFTVGKIEGGSATTIAYTANGTDFAEYFKKDTKEEVFEAGDLVCSGTNGVTKCSSSSPQIIGVVSDRPSFIGGVDKEDDPNYVLVGLVGQLPVKVSTASGTIKTGDYITVSNTSGIAQKVTGAGVIIGKALENFSSCQSGASAIDSIVPPAAGLQNDNPCTGKVLTAISVTWYDPSVYLTNSGDLNINQISVDSYALTGANGESITTVGAFNTAKIGALNAGKITAKQITTTLLSTDQLNIKGQSLDEYIHDYLVKHDVLAPTTTTASESGIRNQESGATESAVLSATDSAKVATPSAVIDNSIETKLKNLSEEFDYLTSKVNILQGIVTSPNATQSGALSASTSGSLLSSSVILNSFQDIGILNQVQNDSGNATISGQLSVVGRTLLTNVGITGTITNGLLTIEGISCHPEVLSGSPCGSNINSKGTLFLQPQQIGGIDILSGKVTIDTFGNIATQGTLKAKEVSTEKLNITNTGLPIATDSAVLSDSTGVVIIKAGTTSVDIQTDRLTPNSLIFVTPEKAVAVGSKRIDTTTIRILLQTPLFDDVKVNWWIIN